MAQIPSYRYRCPNCGNQYPVMLDGNKCFCGGTLFDTQTHIKEDKNLWYTEAFETFPCVLAHEYHRLYELSQTQNTYGVFLQLKDVIESTIKFITLAVCIFGKTQDVKGREEAYEKQIAGEKLSLGNWVDIANLMRSFFKPSNTNYHSITKTRLPSSLWKLLDKLQAWVGNNQLVNWRNEKLGHGALRFDDDPEFQTELLEKINAVTQFYRDNKEAFTAIQIASNGVYLLGFKSARNLSNESSKCELVVDSMKMPASPFILHVEHGIFFYDEMIKRKNSRMLSYPDGHTKLQYNEYTAHLAHLLHGRSAALQSSIESEFITKSENDFLARLSFDSEYIEPKYLTEWLQNCVETHSKGIFLLEMERGCGKTFFTEKLNCRFAKPQIITEDIDVRTYHLSRTQLGGVKEFVAGITSEWNQGFEHSSDMARSISIDYSNEKGNNAIALSEFLRKWQQYTSTSDARYRRQRIMLVLDGLDEIKDSDADIWSFIPTPEQLSDGVYILLTGRNIQTDDLPASYIKRIKALNVSESKRVSATSEDNQSVLKAFIAKAKLPLLEGDLAIELIRMAEYKMLGLSMLCYQIKNEGITDTSCVGMSYIILSYLRMIEKQYNAIGSAIFKRTLCILASICEYEPLSLREIADLLLMGSIKLELLGLLADISPLLTVERIVSMNGDIYWDINRYHFTNTDVTTIVRTYLGSDYNEIIHDIFQTVRTEFQESYSDGSIALISHASSILADARIFIDWKANDITNINLQAHNYYQEVAYNNSIADFRLINIADQIISLSQNLDTNNRDTVITDILDAYYLKLSVCPEIADRFLSVRELMQLISNAHFAEQDSKNYAFCRVYTENALAFSSNDAAQKALEYADKIKRKDKKSKEAEIYACDAYLRTEIREDYENYYFESREDVAKRCLKLILELIKNASDLEKSMLFDVCMRTAFFFEADEEAHNPSITYRYYALYFKHFSDIEKRRILTLKEKGQFVDLQTRLSIFYIIKEEYNKASQYVSSSLNMLKSIKQTSAVITHEYLLERYTEVIACAQKLNMMECISTAVISDVFDQLVEFTWSIPLSLVSTFTKSVDLIVGLCSFISPIHGSKTIQKLIDLVRQLEIIEPLDEAENVGKSIGIIYAHLGLAALREYDCMDDQTVSLYYSFAEKAIKRLELYNEEEEWYARYFTLKCWSAKAAYLSRLRELQKYSIEKSNTEILKCCMLAFYWVLVGLWPPEIHEIELPNWYQMIVSFTITELIQQASALMETKSSDTTLSIYNIKRDVDKYLSNIWKNRTLQTVLDGWKLVSNIVSKMGKKDNLVKKIISAITQAYQDHPESDGYLLACYLPVYYKTTILGHESYGLIDKMTSKLMEAAKKQGALYYHQVTEERETAKRLIEIERKKKEELTRKEEQKSQEEMKHIARLTLDRIEQEPVPTLDSIKQLLAVAKATQVSSDIEQTVLLYQKALDMCKELLADNAKTNDYELLCLHAKVLDCYSAFLSTQNNYSFIPLRMNMIDTLEKLTSIRPGQYEENLASLYEGMGNVFDRVGNDSQARKMYTSAKNMYEKMPNQRAKVKRINSWFQAHDKLTIYGHIQCRLMEFKESDYESVRTGTNKCLWENRFCMCFSKESLLPIIDSTQEKEFFYRLLDDINGREVWFFMKPGGNNFKEATSCCSVEEYLTLANKWMEDLDELGFPDYLYERLVNKNSLWVCEFFTKLLHYGKMKYSS